MKQVIGQQGEVRIVKIDEIPECETASVKRTRAGFVISHSEQGHHHCVTGGDVMERTSDVPEGMKIFYGILENPEAFIQDAPTPHKKIDLPPGIYEFRVSREYDPFGEQARRVAD